MSRRIPFETALSRWMNGLKAFVNELQRPGDPARHRLGLVDRVDLRDLLADRDVQRGRDDVGERQRERQRDAVRDAVAEEVLEDRGDRRLAEEADAQRGQRDAQLAGREVAREIVELRQHQPRALDALLDLLLDPGAPHAHERELGRDEEPVQQHEHEDREQEQAGHVRAVAGGRARGAPLLREESSSFMQRRPDGTHPTRRQAGQADWSRSVSLLGHADRVPRAVGDRDALRARPRPGRHRRTHECDHPPAARDLPKVTRDVIGPGLAPAEIDRAVRELTEQGQAIYELDEAALRRAQPDLIVTQALCAVCAVSYDDVKTVAQAPGPGARGASRSTRTRSARCSATSARSPPRPAARTPASTSCRTPPRGSTACGWPCATPRPSASRRSSGWTRSTWPATGRRR